MKKILVQKQYNQINWIDPPAPSTKNIPRWFRDMSPYPNGKLEVSDRTSLLTVKKCMPFFDAMSSGYTFCLPADVLVDKNSSNNFLFNWKVSDDIISSHFEFQLGDMPVSEEFVKTPFKWHNNYIVKTPLGYSCIFSHPHNRPDLPFYTLSGIVDTDSFDLAVNFVFLMKNNFTGVIPAGTPVAQMLPFKRENWEIKEIDPLESFEVRKKQEKLKSKLTNFYKNNYWSKKTYK